MDNYKPNSYKSKAEPAEKKIEKVVKGPVKVKNKTEMHKFRDIFIAEDASSVTSYIFMDVLVPAVKKAVVDIVKDGIEMLVYGEARPRDRNRGTNASYVSYSKYSDSRDDDRWRNETRARTSGYSYKDIVLGTRGEAEEVLATMDSIIDEYKMVSVADLYDLVGITGNYTDQKYGWTNLRNAEPIHVRDGYMLKLPKAFPIN